MESNRPTIEADVDSQFKGRGIQHNAEVPRFRYSQRSENMSAHSPNTNTVGITQKDGKENSRQTRTATGTCENISSSEMGIDGLNSQTQDNSETETTEDYPAKSQIWLQNPWWQEYTKWLQLPKSPVMRAEKVPLEMRESYILTGYRPPCLGVIPSAKSAFYIHNETLNFWTHMIPFFYFAYNLFLDQGPWQRLALISPLGRYPFYGYMIGICSLFGASSFAHLFHCAGRRRWRNICFVMDYAAISVYGTASAIAYYFYSRPRFRGTFIGYILSGEGHFLGFTTATAWVATYASCQTRLRPSRFCYAIRTAAFTLPFIVGSFPALARWVSAGAILTGSSANDHIISKLNETEKAILLLGSENKSSPHYTFPNLDYDFQTPYTRHIIMLAGGALINVLKIPERFWPGRFDALGSSHQWFHILVFLSIREQFWLMLEEIACHSGLLYLRDPDSSMPWGRATITPGRSQDAYCTIITSTSYTSPSLTDALSAGSSAFSSTTSYSSTLLTPWGWLSLLLCALWNPRASLDTWMVLNTITWMTVLLGVLTLTIVWFGYSYGFEFSSNSVKENSSDEKKEK